jgi:hypothetical protein
MSAQTAAVCEDVHIRRRFELALFGGKLIEAVFVKADEVAHRTRM